MTERFDAQLVGGPHCGLHLTIGALHDHLEPSVVTGYDAVGNEVVGEEVRYRLDQDCVDDNGSLVTKVARYLYDPPALSPA